MSDPYSIDALLAEAIGSSPAPVLTDSTPGRTISQRLPTAPSNPQATETAPQKFVTIKGFNAETGSLDDLALDGNFSDMESTVLTGLVKADSYTSIFERGSNTFSRRRGNEAFTLFPLAIRNTVQTFPTDATGALKNFNARGAHFIINITAAPGGQTMTPSILAWDVAGAAWYPLLTGAAIAATGVTVLKIYPGLSPVANNVANDVLPFNFALRMTPSGAGNWTYSASCNMVL